jgi:ABC-type Fe3+-hydroxamate transport system substrate-binding protein
MKVVSLCPSLTELVFALERGLDLVGVTDYCVHPAELVRGIEKVGGTKNPDVARIVALAPDLVLMNREENRSEDANALRAAGVSVHDSMPRTVTETSDMVRSIAAALSRVREGERIVAAIEARLSAARARAGSAAPVRFAYLIWRKPWMSVNGDTFASDMLVQAGGENVFAARPVRYPEVTPEQLAETAPELVLLSSEPFPFEEKHADELARLAGLPRASFALADGEYLSWHGSRTPDGIDHASLLLEAARRARELARPQRQK